MVSQQLSFLGYFLSHSLALVFTSIPWRSCLDRAAVMPLLSLQLLSIPRECPPFPGEIPILMNNPFPSKFVKALPILPSYCFCVNQFCSSFLSFMSLCGSVLLLFFFLGLSCLKGELKIVAPKNKLTQRRENSSQKTPER